MSESGRVVAAMVKRSVIQNRNEDLDLGGKVGTQGNGSYNKGKARNPEPQTGAADTMSWRHHFLADIRVEDEHYTLDLSRADADLKLANRMGAMRYPWSLTASSDVEDYAPHDFDSRGHLKTFYLCRVV